MTFLTHPQDGTIQRYVDGSLGEAESRTVRSHLGDCASCRARASDMSVLFAALAEPVAPVEPPVSFFDSVMARVDREILVLRPREHRLAIGARALAGSAAVCAGGAALAWANGAGVPIPSMPAELVTGAAHVFNHFGVFAAVLKAAAPIFAGAMVASLALVTPFFLRAMSSIQRPVRVPVRG